MISSGRENYMKEYACSDSYIIRKVGLPIKYLLSFENQRDIDVYTFIKNDAYLDSYFRKALFFSSKSLYNSYINPPSSKKKYKNLNLGLLKFLVRATTRTTPYGYFSKVGIASFFGDKNLQKETEILDVFVEKEWITKLVNKLEMKLLKSLKYKVNNNAYISGDRYKIPHIKSSKERVSEVDMRNTAAIKLIVYYAKDFVEYENLEEVLLDNYPKVSKEKIQELIMMLLESNVIYSNLRIPTYCLNPLSYAYECLISVGYYGEELAILKKIQECIQIYKN